MNIILLGPQGSGKGTQAELLTEKYHLQHLEMGRIFRCSKDPEIIEMVNKGKLAPDEVTGKIATEFIEKHHPRVSGFVFEGYPRTIDQYQHVKDILGKYGRKIDMLFNIEISEDETIARLSKRRTCENCGKVFSREGVCDNCGGMLKQREDDKPAAIKRRLAIYRKLTHPVFEQAVLEGVGVKINGQQTIEQVFKEIDQRVFKLSMENRSFE